MAYYTWIKNWQDEEKEDEDEWEREREQEKMFCLDLMMYKVLFFN